jgi:hypothetical protein
MGGGSPWQPRDGEVVGGELKDGGGLDCGSVGLDFRPEMNYGSHGTWWCGR